MTIIEKEVWSLWPSLCFFFSFMMLYTEAHNAIFASIYQQGSVAYTRIYYLEPT